MSGRRSGSKAKFRFHGGIGDGRGGLACQMPQENASPRLIKLFDELNPIDMLIEAPSVGFLENHVARVPTLPLEASNGTGVFLPVYPKKIRSKQGQDNVFCRRSWQSQIYLRAVLPISGPPLGRRFHFCPVVEKVVINVEVIEERLVRHYWVKHDLEFVDE
ncbi:hypothetical protein Tco_0092123 [Tanacetum coccineum]